MMPPMKTQRHLPGALALFLTAAVAQAQTAPVAEPAWPFEERDELETDRDSFTPAVTTAGRGRFIFESAYSFLDNRGVKETHSFPELLVRYGLTDRLELRLGWNYEVGGAGNDTSGSGGLGEGELSSVRSLERATNASFGLKYRVTDQDGMIPGSSFVLQGSTPTSGPETDTQFTGTYVFGWELPRRWKLDAAMRYRTDAERADDFNTWAPSVVLKVPVAERVTVHGEYFGLYSQGKERDFVKHYVSPGVHYLITDDLEVGVRVGWGLNDQAARFFVNAGVGLRF